MLASNEAPDQSYADDSTDNIACPDMLSQKVIFGKVSNKERQNQHPVADSNDGIPDPYRVVRGFHDDYFRYAYEGWVDPDRESN